ncbi:MAG: hypothetical protein ACJ8LN_13725 [Sulfurifustis sp.]
MRSANSRRAGYCGIALAVLGLLPMAVPAQPPAGANIELPREYVDTTYMPPRGRTLAVRAGGDFQAALAAAAPGDIITLEAGATFRGPFTLPVKPGADWIIVRSSAGDGDLPPGERVDPSRAAFMPKLVSAAGPVLTTMPGAHHYRFIGIEIRPEAGQEAAYRRAFRSFVSTVRGRTTAAATGFAGRNLVLLGNGETSVDKLPHHFVFDRCYIHGDAKGGSRRGIALNSRYTAVIDSYFADFKEVGADSQAILGWNGPGPFKIVDNYLEGAGENIMFGGSPPTIPDMVPADIEIRRNHFYKPLRWQVGHPTYEGTPWTVKNLFELKNARRVLVDGNLFEQNWVHAQNGFAILFTVRAESDAAKWAVVEDVTFANNVVRRSAAGVNVLGIDDTSPTRSGRTRRIAIKNNLFDEIGGAPWGGGGRLFQLLDGTEDIVIAHNTALQTENILFGGDGKPHARVVFANNVAPHNEYGIIGSGQGVGRPSLERYFPGAVVLRNVMPGGSARMYPPDNFFPQSLDDVGFKLIGADYRLKDSSRYKSAASDGRDVGVDFDALWSALGPTLSAEAHKSR